ncbi:hypothetical protein C8F01DRAFT_972220 [Mycena amicta]|nr:hypothetical protein C8F01DRAFT_972220 [Mycena amicta]
MILIICSILRYPADGPGALPISIRDLGFLAPRKFLNDAIVQFGLQLAFEELRAKNPQIADSLHIFSSFFYKKLSAERIEDTYPAVAKWTKRVDIFAKEYLIIPIHDMARHWYLAIICHPSHLLGSNTNGKSYCLTLDSLNADHEPMAALLHTYLKLEAQQKHQEPVDSRLIYVKAKVPQQDNGYDCGVYLLHLAKHFMQDPSGRLSLILVR